MKARLDPSISLLSEEALFRDGVTELLHRNGFTKIAQFATDNALRAAAGRRGPEVVIVDLDHERSDTMMLVRSLRRELPAAHLVMIGTPTRQAAADTQLDATVDTPNGTRAELAAATRGRPRHRTAQLVRELRRWQQITPRQRDVMRWLAIGLDNGAIARKLRVGERAVKAHITKLLDTFQLANRTQLALLADHAGLRPPVALAA